MVLRADWRNMLFQVKPSAISSTEHVHILGAEQVLSPQVVSHITDKYLISNMNMTEMGEESNSNFFFKFKHL